MIKGISGRRNKTCISVLQAHIPISNSAAMFEIIIQFRCLLSHPEAEFKEFKPRLKLYSNFLDLSRRSIETGFWALVNQLIYRVTQCAKYLERSDSARFEHLHEGCISILLSQILAALTLTILLKNENVNFFLLYLAISLT